MTVHEIELRKPVRIPREIVQQRDNFRERHELSLLELLIEAHPERAKIIIERISLQKQAA